MAASPVLEDHFSMGTGLGDRFKVPHGASGYVGEELLERKNRTNCRGF
jgi:hypothetical protein